MPGRQTLRLGIPRTECYGEEYFFDNAPVNFGGYFQDLKDLVIEHKEYLFSGVGLIDQRNNQFCMLFNRGNNFLYC